MGWRMEASRGLGACSFRFRTAGARALSEGARTEKVEGRPARTERYVSWLRYCAVMRMRRWVALS